MLLRSSRPARRAVVVTLALLAVTASACGSDSDSDAATTEAPTAEATTPVVTNAPADTSPAGTSPDTVDASSPECNGLSAAEVGAAAGGAFDSADDVSVDADHSCLFSDSMTGDGVVLLRQGADTYLAGSLDGAPIDEALTTLEASYTTVMDEPTASRPTIGGSPAVVVAGTSSIAGTPVAYAATVVDGEVIEVSADGAGLAADAAGFVPIVTAVLELAVAAQG